MSYVSVYYYNLPRCHDDRDWPEPWVLEKGKLAVGLETVVRLVSQARLRVWCGKFELLVERHEGQVGNDLPDTS